MNVLSATDGSDASKAAEALFAAVVRREVVEVTVLSVTGASSGSGAGALSGDRCKGTFRAATRVG